MTSQSEYDEESLQMDQDNYQRCLNEETDLREELEMYHRELKASDSQERKEFIQPIVRNLQRIRKTKRELLKRIRNYLQE